MPAWVDTPREERAWRKAKRVVSKQRGKSEDEFTDRDWGLVTHIAKNMLEASSSSIDPSTHIALARVEKILDARKKAARREKDSLLSASDQTLVSALSQVAALGGQTIAAVRDAAASHLSPSESAALTAELQAVAIRLTDILSKVKG